jgi:hypothetical protein
MNAAELFLATTIVCGGTAITFAFVWWREHHRRLDLQRQVEDLEMRMIGMDSLQASVDNVAREVERIGEIERFALERLLAGEAEMDRPRIGLPHSGRVSTPH